jgi:hypothetical protein
MSNTVSIILWGGSGAGDVETASQADPPGHVAVAIHPTVSQPVTCSLHHARCPDQVRFIYEWRPMQPFEADPAPRGRCDLRNDLSDADVERANEVLTHFGADKIHLPFYGEGNCHNWTAAAVGALEKVGLARPGDGQLWTEMIGRGPTAMEKTWRAAGKDFVCCEKFGKAAPEVVHARWADEIEQVGVGTLEKNEQLRERMEAVKRLMSGP